MKISKKDLRRIIFEGVAASLEEKKKSGKKGKKGSKKSGEDPPPETDNQPSDPAPGNATERDIEKAAMEQFLNARDAHKKGDIEKRDELLQVVKNIVAPNGNVVKGQEDTIRVLIAKAKSEMGGLVLDFSPKVSTKPQAQAQRVRAAKPKSRSNPKTAYIQKVIKAPSSDGGKKEGDGQWGKNTSDAWRAWVKKPDTLKKFAALLAKEKSEKQADDERIEQLKILGMIDDDKGKTNESRDLYELFSKIISEQEEKNPVQAAVDRAVAADKAAMEALPKELQELIQAGDAAKIAAYFKLSPNLAGVEQLVKKLEGLKATDDKDKEKEKSEDETSGGDSKASVELITPASKAGFEGIKDLVNGPVDKGEMSQIHALIFAMSKAGQFKKVKAESGKGSKDPLYLAIKDTFGKKGHEIAYQVLKNFSLGPTPHSRIIFPIAGETNMYKVDGKPAETGALGNVSYSVLVDDVENMLKGKDPVYAPGGKKPTVTESNSERLSHGALIRKRYRRY